MKFSTALINLLLGCSLTLSNGKGYGELTRDRLERNIQRYDTEDTQSYHELRRQLDGDALMMDFSYFEGDWYNCLHTTLMTFNGEPAEKHIVEQVGCDFGNLGTVTKVGNNDQTLQFDILLLNHCFFHDLGGEGQKACPNDLLDSDDRGDGNILVKYSFKGIGSFADGDTVEFFSDHTYLKDENGNWKPNRKRAHIENMDTMVCQKYMNGIVCDWRINEYRTSSKMEHGCMSSKGKCKPKMNRKRCEKKAGTWTEECPVIHREENGFVYDSFGSYYLVKDTDQCKVTCATDAPSTADQTPSPEAAVSGCYRGGQCGSSHGCCDCSIKDEESCTENENPGIWSDGCRGICRFF